MKRFLFPILFIFSATTAALACGPFAREYHPDSYFTYRVQGNDMEGAAYPEAVSREEQKKQNLQSWAELTSDKIPLSEIEEVVYDWSFGKMRYQAASFKTEKSSNEFMAWLQEHNDREVVDFLLLAKECESLRAKQNTAWYYFYPGDTICRQLSDLVQRAKAYRKKRLRDRYAVQELRAWFGMREYDKCLSFWSKKKRDFHPGIIKDLAVGYVAGAYMRMNQYDKACQLYIDNGLMGDALLCKKGMDSWQLFQQVYQINPDHPWLLSGMQSRIHKMERWEGLDEQDYGPLYSEVKEIVAGRRCKDLSPWLYTAAFLSDKVGQHDSAWYYICRAETEVGTADLKDAIRVLKIYLRTKTVGQYTQDYENELYSDLVWLDTKIVGNLTPEIAGNISWAGIDNHICGYSQYYWSDMMRKILISQVVPLCIRSNYKARALEYLNMADNRIFGLLDKMYFSDWVYNPATGDYDEIEKVMTLSEYRLSADFHNGYDYMNDLFFNLDSLGIQHIVNMVNRMEHPKSPLDHFLKERSYTDLQYFYDIIGTQLIASMRYEEAVGYLERVSDDFQRSRNVFSYCKVDPFTEKKLKSLSPTYKLDFAREMASLQKQIKSEQNPNRKAELMLKLSKGMMNSTDKDCWPLTSYFRGSADFCPGNSQYQGNLTKALLAAADENKKKAFALFTDKEKKAKAYYEWKMFKSAAAQCPGTKTAAFVKGHCDNLRDYDAIYLGVMN